MFTYTTTVMLYNLKGFSLNAEWILGSYVFIMTEIYHTNNDYIYNFKTLICVPIYYVHEGTLLSN